MIAKMIQRGLIEDHTILALNVVRGISPHRKVIDNVFVNKPIPGLIDPKQRQVGQCFHTALAPHRVDSQAWRTPMGKQDRIVSHVGPVFRAQLDSSAVGLALT